MTSEESQTTIAELTGRVPPPELLIPMEDRVVVRLDDEFAGAMSEGGIYIPEETEERRPATGTVVRCGAGCLTLKPGYRVLLIKMAGIDIPLPRQRSDEEGSWCTYHEIETLGFWTNEDQETSGTAHGHGEAAAAAEAVPSGDAGD